ncbi:hypothetical protein BGZ94_008560 [Podila epigama]|nr:hypothetical protein BGZ94_008560 [Podila epigama]
MISRFAVVLTSILVVFQIWMTNPVQAMGYAACIGIKDVSEFKMVYGFHLWQTDGVQAHHYITSWFFRPQNTLENKGWRICPILDRHQTKHGPTRGLIRPVVVANKDLGINQLVDDKDLVTVCRYLHDDRFRGLTLICQDDADNVGWCKSNENSFFRSCAEYLDMGNDSLSCDKSKRPKP